MMANYFSVGCNWTGKGESTAELGGNALRTFDAISALTPLCKNWEVMDLKRESMISLDMHRAGMTALIEQGMAHDDFGDPAPEYGYRLSGTNDYVDQSERISIKFHGAMKLPKWNRGSVVFKTPKTESPNPAITNYPLMRAILLALADIWKPDFGFCDTNALYPFRRDPSPTFDIAWMTYLSPSLARRLGPLGAITAELVKGGGLLLIAAKETFDVANPAHLAAASTIRDATAPLNASLPRPPWMR